jgi:hypothetical protein
MSRVTVVPAYGRDYKSKAALLADWESDKDFAVADMSSSGYINRSDAIACGVTQVTARYQRQTKLLIIRVSK